MDLKAIIITHHPPSEFLSNLDNWKCQFDQLLIIDNGSDLQTQSLLQQASQERRSEIEIILNKTNLGMATALNQGFSWALKQGSDFIFAFDQDSQPASDMIETLLYTFHSYPDHEKIVVVAPKIKDSINGTNLRYLRSRGRFLFERVDCTGGTLENVSVVITSGALYNLKVYQKLGPFRDEFFIDYVDTEYCLRARQHGFNVIVNCDAHLYHRLGNQQKKSVGPLTMYPTFHSPERWYYIARNRIQMFQLYALRFPHWFFYELIIGTYGLVRLLLFEDRKVKKLQALVLGTLDGLARHMGPISDSRRALIEKNR